MELVAFGYPFGKALAKPNLSLSRIVICWRSYHLGECGARGSGYSATPSLSKARC